jgi:hypothetical protein
VNTVGKQHFTSLFSPARERAFTTKNIKAGFAATGLVPFNPDRVLRDMPKPPADLTIPEVDEVKVGSCPQDVVPQAPVTPVSAEAFMSLQNLIIQRDAHALETRANRAYRGTYKRSLKAPKDALPRVSCKNDQIRFLNTINNEAKVRRSTKALVLCTAKVMSYEDLQEARAKRAEEDAAKEAKDKGRRGRKRKSATPEAEEATAVKAKPNAKVARMSKASARASVVQMSGTPVAEDEIVPGPWRAPVAQMY